MCVLLGYGIIAWDLTLIVGINWSGSFSIFRVFCLKY